MRKPNNHKRFASVFVYRFFIITLLALLALSGCQIEMGGKKNGKDDKDIAVPVTLGKITRGDISAYLRYNSSLDALREIKIYSQATGLVTKLTVEAGDRVKSGTILINLERSDQELAVKRAEASIHRETQNLKRVNDLFKQQMIAEDKFQDAELALRDAELNLEQAQLALAKTVITAPFSGIIGERFINLGDRVDPSRPLFTLVDQSSLLFDVWISEMDAGEIVTGLHGDVKLAYEPDFNLEAELIRVSPVLDPNFAKLKATFQLVDNPVKLKPGQLIELRLLKERRENVMILPKRALVYQSGTPTVFTYQPSDSLVLITPVLTGLEDVLNIELKAGLQEDQLIVIEGQSTLRDSTKVKPIQALRGV